MSRYRSYGKLDDPFTSEGDTFFLRMNARLRPNQLKAGEVALSKNGRMNKDGTWQTRKGLSTLFGSITSGFFFFLFFFFFFLTSLFYVSSSYSSIIILLISSFIC